MVTMANGKAHEPKRSKENRIPNKHLYSRVSYLYQAANYLASLRTPSAQSSDHEHDNDESLHVPRTASVQLKGHGLPLLLTSNMVGVSLKGQISLSADMKHSVCNRCSSLLIAGSTSSTRIENLSRNGRKPWADVLVIQCLSCGAEKRFPVGAERQNKTLERQERKQKKQMERQKRKKCRLAKSASISDRSKPSIQR